MKKYDICIPICAGEHTEHERAIFFHDMLPPLHIRFRCIALLAQHLQVVVGDMPAFASRNDADLLSYIIIQHKFLDVRFQSVASVLDFP